MSHYMVMVFGDNVEEQLQPYHEFECTGQDDQYVTDEDVTLEKMVEWKEGEGTFLQNEDGTPFCAYDDRFYRDPLPAERAEIGPFGGTGTKGGISWQSKDWGDGQRRPKVRYVPEGFKEVRLKYSEVYTFREYLEDHCERTDFVKHGEAPKLGNPFDEKAPDDHKYGYIQLDAKGDVAKVVRRTNPDAKWDWWVVGGRSHGFLPVKEGVTTAGRQPMAEERPSWKDALGVAQDVYEPRTVDQCLFGEIDFDRAYSEAAAAANSLFDEWEELFKQHPQARSWPSIRAEVIGIGDDADWEKRPEAVAKYNEQPLVQAYKQHDRFRRWYMECPVDAIGYEREAFVRRRKAKAMIPFAILRNGKWHQKGHMGWFGCVSNEQEPETWNDFVNNLYKQVGEDEMVTVVDCHI